MTINTRAIAVQGIGFAVALVAVQGLAPYAVEQIEAATPGYRASLGAVSYQARHAEQRRAQKLPALLRAQDTHARTAETGPTIYRANSVQRTPAADATATRVAASDGLRAAVDPSNRRSARSAKT